MWRSARVTWRHMWSCEKPHLFFPNFPGNLQDGSVKDLMSKRGKIPNKQVFQLSSTRCVKAENSKLLIFTRRPRQHSGFAFSTLDVCSQPRDDGYPIRRPSKPEQRQQEDSGLLTGGSRDVRRPDSEALLKTSS